MLTRLYVLTPIVNNELKIDHCLCNVTGTRAYFFTKSNQLLERNIANLYNEIKYEVWGTEVLKGSNY